MIVEPSCCAPVATCEGGKAEAPAPPEEQPSETVQPAPTEAPKVEPAPVPPAEKPIDQPKEQPAPKADNAPAPAVEEKPAMEEKPAPEAKPVEEKPAPEAKPVEEKPAPEANPAMEEKPTETPKPEAGKESKDALDDLFGKPEAKPEAQPEMKPEVKPEAKAETLDDLFGTPPAKPEAKPETKPAADAADPFSAVQPQELPTRLWLDNTGSFQIRARLVGIEDGAIRLLKDNGKTSTVPLRRLSDADQQYVQGIAAQFGQGAMGQLAAR
ncbi:MAG: SHD1 domain-containing protein [Planctomycetota bacterium]|nr:SHD1 domain-containing protein [Planctomycetota bacterium]